MQDDVTSRSSACIYSYVEMYWESTRYWDGDRETIAGERISREFLSGREIEREGVTRESESGRDEPPANVTAPRPAAAAHFRETDPAGSRDADGDWVGWGGAAEQR